jgi:hypothetical protein
MGSVASQSVSVFTQYRRLIMIIAVVGIVAVSGYVAMNQFGGGTKYYNSFNDAYYMELNDDLTFYVKDMSNTEVTGKYEISGSTLTFKPDGGLPTRRGKIDGNTITDPDGDKWVKR